MEFDDSTIQHLIEQCNAEEHKPVMMKPISAKAFRAILEELLELRRKVIKDT